MPYVKDEQVLKPSQPSKHYPTEEAKIRGIAKEEILALLEDKEFLASLKEKLKPEIKTVCE